MKKFKIGDKVKYISSDGELVLNSIHTITLIDELDDVAPYLLDNNYWVEDSDITLAEKTWDTLEAGDILVDTDGDEAIIIDAFPNSFLKSFWGNFNRISNIYSKKQAQTKGWTIKGAVADPVKEMTLEDVEKLVGSKVKIIK